MAPLVFVVGGTGAQGIPVIRGLVKDGAYRVRALTRDLNSARAKQLLALGNVELQEGSFASETDLRAGLGGAQAAFVNIDGFNSGEKTEMFWAMRSYELALEAGLGFFVYDNYSKLISATETIRKMRANMDPLNPMASTLDPAIAQIYAQASAMRDALRETVPAPGAEARAKEEALARRRRTRKLASAALDTPARLRSLVADGKVLEAQRQWEMPRRLLVVWRDAGVGGVDVQACIDEGDAAVGRAKSPATDSGSSKDDSS
ncbi:hypothetical protein BN1723_012173 [Verticillium longisporum]|uniref:NmrA-like domain-containing protein n=1 Tax=Verticillium longisporum TaxID=100787 RepID=A0A0G4LFQ4_VERLO|nr:hypothetical protein BN1723_012173 [Verticillium longisporum]